jgi:signal transduction histidine kinase
VRDEANMSGVAGLDDAGEGPASAVEMDSRLLGELLGLLAHDLRNPLSALHSNLGYLDSVMLSHGSEARDAIDDGVVSCDGLSHVIDNVDLLGQVLRGNLRVHKNPSPVAALVAGAVERCQSAARSHGLSLDLAEDARKLHAVVDVARDLASKALVNLIRNSIQHAPPSSTVWVTARSEADRVCICVRDRGVALGDELRTRAFTAEGQVEAKTRAHSRYSRGMGLYCAQLAATLCGGQLEAVDGDEKGNTFELRLPLARPA